MAKISVITASYNYDKYISETIESVISQTYDDWELIIIDDGSTDNSVNIINEYCKNDKRIRLYQHENGVNKGLAETIKLGLSKATSDWIVFLESDDTIEPTYMEEKLAIVNKYPEVNFIFNDVNLFGDDVVIAEYNSYFQKRNKILKKMSFPIPMLKIFKKTHTNLITTFSIVMVKKVCFEGIDFNSPIKKALDYYLWIQIAKQGFIYYLKKSLTNWRMHKKSYINAEISSESQELDFQYKRLEFLYGVSSFYAKLFLLKKF